MSSDHNNSKDKELAKKIVKKIKEGEFQELVNNYEKEVTEAIQLSNEEYTRNIVNPKNLFNYLKQYIVGNDEACKNLSILLSIQFYKYESKGTTGLRLPSLNGLIMGPSGSGKSYMIDKLTSHIHLSLVKVDTTTITPNGWAGESLDKFLGTHLYGEYYRMLKSQTSTNPDGKVFQLYDEETMEKCKDYIRYAVIYVDEVDKMCPNSGHDRQSSHWYQNRMDCFLKLMDGINLPIGPLGRDESLTPLFEINTKNFLWVFSGSFGRHMDIKKSISRPIGIKANYEEHEKELTKPLTKDEMVKYGMTKEFMGRIHTITSTNSLDRSQIEDVIQLAQDNVLDEFKHLFRHYNKEAIHLSREDIDYIVDEVLKSDFGMRHIKTILFELFRDRLFSIRSNPTEEELDNAAKEYYRNRK